MLLFAHDIETLASLYAIGVIGAVAINITLCSIHPRLRRWWRKAPMFAIGMSLVAIEITLALTKLHALIFACVVLIIGLTLGRSPSSTTRRGPSRACCGRRSSNSSPNGDARREASAGHRGVGHQRPGALDVARRENASLVVCFMRDVALSYKIKAGESFTLDTDPAAQALFRDFLARGIRRGCRSFLHMTQGTKRRN